MLEQLGLGVDMPVEVELDGDKITIRRRRQGRIGLAARLAMCDVSIPLTSEEQVERVAWESAPAVGLEPGSSAWTAMEEAADPEWVRHIEELDHAAGRNLDR